MEHFTPNRSIVANAMGSAIQPDQAFKEEMERKLSKNSYFMQGKKYHNKRYDVFKNQKYKEMREKFNRTIDSSAFRSEIERPSAINVI